MRINYVTTDGNLKLASYRYHVLTPANELGKLGHRVEISEYPLKGYDAYVFRKHLRKEETLMIQTIKNREPNCKTYFIVCDYHLDSKHRDHYLKMIKYCDVLVVCTNEMQRLLKEETGKDSVVIKDPWGVEFDECEPRFEQKSIYDLLWFGSRTNLQGVVDCLPDIGNHRLMIVTDEMVLQGVTDNDSQAQFRCAIYLPQIVKEEMVKCDAVIIPQNVTDKRRNVKTHNRLVDSIRNGRFVIASPVDAYKELKDYCYLGTIKDGLDWLSKQKPETIVNMIKAGQEYIRKEFSPEKIGKDWETLFMRG